MNDIFVSSMKKPAKKSSVPMCCIFNSNLENRETLQTDWMFISAFLSIQNKVI